VTMMRKCLIGTVIVVAAMAEPVTALACSPSCGGLEPHGTAEAPAHLPANGVFVTPPYTTSATDFTIVRTRAGASETLTIPFEYRGVLITDVRPGDRLVVSVMSSCTSSMDSTVIEVTAEAALPTVLGVLEVEASRPTPVAVWDNRGGCTSDLASTAAPFTVTLDASVEPWRDALTETVLVDDAPWWGASDARVAPRFVFTACEPSLESQVGGPDLPLGAHRLRVQGSLRGLEGTFVSNEETFHLDCASGASCTAAAPTHRPLRGPWLLALASIAGALGRMRGRARS